MFGLRSSSDSRTDIWRIQFICGQLTRSQTFSSPGRIFTVLTFLPFEVVVLLQGVRSNCRQDGDLSLIGFLDQLLCRDIQFRTLSPFPQFSEGFPWSDRYSRSLKSCSILFCGSHYPTPCYIQQTHGIQGAMFIFQVLPRQAWLNMWQAIY